MWEIELLQLPYFADERELSARLADEGEEALRQAIEAVTFAEITLFHPDPPW